MQFLQGDLVISRPVLISSSSSTIDESSAFGSGFEAPPPAYSEHEQDEGRITVALEGLNRAVEMLEEDRRVAEELRRAGF